MKYIGTVVRAIYGIVGLLACCLGSGSAKAQCQIIYNPGYAVYASESTDGNGNIFTSVLTDGSASMSVGFGCPDSIRNAMQQAINSATHTPSAYNVIGSTGGYGTGSTGCASCYLTYQNNQSIAATEGVSYSFQHDGQVNCSVGGNIFSSLLVTEGLSLHKTYGANTKGSQVIANVRFCTETPNCSSGTPICGVPTWTSQVTPATLQCLPFVRTSFLRVITSNSDHCYGVDFPATGAGVCD